MPIFAMALASRSGSGFCSGTLNEFCLGLCAAGVAFLVAAVVLCSKSPDTITEATILPRHD